MRYFLTAIATLFLWTSGLAQKDNISILWKSKKEIADQLFEDRLYAEALNDYLEIAYANEILDGNRVNQFPQLTLRIADCFFKLRKLEAAIPYYSLTIEQSDTVVYAQDDVLRYAESLLYNEQIDEAKKWFNEYYITTKNGLGKERFLGVANYEEYLESTKPTIIESWSNNSMRMELIPVILGQELYFSSQEPMSRFSDPNYLAGDQETLSLYLLDSNGITSVKTGSLFNVTSPAFGDDSKVIISASAKGDDRLSLFEGTTKSATKWSGFRDISLNDTLGSTISPSYSATKDTLFFASNRPGGYGGFDLYYSVLTDGNWSKATNLGPFINTQGDEMYPLSYDEKLYFSSNGHAGMGGFDNFYVEGDKVINMAAPINSSQDDFAIFYTTPSTGYFTSNRKGGQGKDDLYQFVQTEDPEVDLTIMLTRKWNGAMMPDAYVRLTSLDNSHNLEGLSLEDGSFREIVHTRTKYLLTIEKEGMLPIKDTLRVVLQDINLDLQLDELFTFQAFVFAKEDGAALSRPVIFVDDPATGTSTEVQGNETGYFEIKKPTNTLASLLITRDGYGFATDTIRFDKQEFSKTYSLSKVKPAGTLTLKDLLYELDQYKLKDDYVPVLDSIATSLKKFENLRIIVESHTDSRGSNDYNLQLSQKRAESVKDYLISKGVAPDKVGAVGKGETELLNKCKDGVSCSDEEHKVNRRTEIKLYRSE